MQIELQIYESDSDVTGIGVDGKWVEFRTVGGNRIGLEARTLERGLAVLGAEMPWDQRLKAAADDAGIGDPCWFYACRYHRWLSKKTACTLCGDGKVVLLSDLIAEEIKWLAK